MKFDIVKESYNRLQEKQYNNVQVLFEDVESVCGDYHYGAMLDVMV